MVHLLRRDKESIVTRVGPADINLHAAITRTADETDRSMYGPADEAHNHVHVC